MGSSYLYSRIETGKEMKILKFFLILLVFILIIIITKYSIQDIKKEKKTSTIVALALAYLTAIGVVAGILSIPSTSSDTDTDHGSGTSSGNTDASEHKETPIVFPCEAEYEGIVTGYDSYNDFYGHARKDVIYMEYDGTSSSIILHTNSSYSKISFDFYAVEGMDPTEMAYLSLSIDNYTIQEFAAIPNINNSGNFYADIAEVNEVRISFAKYGVPREGYPCAVILDNINLE